MRPFLSYYGSKFKLTRMGAYPPPRYSEIIEPFAGGAGYSLYWHDRDVTLIEVDPSLVAVWRWLIAAKPEDILSLPLIALDQTRDDVTWPCEEAKLFVGYWLSPGNPYSCNKPTSWTEGKSSSWCAKTREDIARQIHIIDHWSIIEGSYDVALDYLAYGLFTFFIDPPYEGKPGLSYRFGSNKLDYSKVATFCKSLNGQIIVCESTKANWLDFQPLCAQWGIKGWSNEAVALLGHRNGQVELFEDVQLWA